MRPHGSAAELERRRRLAVKRVNSGYTQREVADFLGVHPTTVWRWMESYRQHGKAGLKSKPHPGRTPKLDAEQEREVLSWFARSPTDFGFSTELWTAPRVAKLIKRTFGVQFHPRYVNRWLAQRRITPQKPRRRPRERDDAKINRWIAEDWPRIKRGLPAAAPIWY